MNHLLRRLFQHRVFTLITIATLAIGIGANSAMFAVVESVLLKPLPFPHSEQLINVDQSASGVGMERTGGAPFLYLEYRDEARTLQNVGLWSRDMNGLTGLAEPEEIPTIDVTEEILPALQIQPLLGRPFTTADTTIGNGETVIASYDFWQTKFGGDPAIIGRGIILDGRPREIIGVLPRDFHFLDLKPALLLPLRLDLSQVHLGNFSHNALARLKPGVTLEQANADVGRMIPIALRRFPPAPGYSKAMFDDARFAAAVQPLKQSLLGDVGKVLWVLMATVAMVLLIACANVANLMLVRAQGREHELALRTALGAGRRQIAKELLSESIALGLLGGLAGVGLAYGALRLLVALAPADLPRLSEVSLDLPSLLFTLAISVIAGLLFGAILSLRFGAPQLGLSLRSGGRSMSRSKEHSEARNTLVVGQIALALVLLVSSGLMIRTFQELRQVDPGFTGPDQVQTFAVYITPAGVKDPMAVVQMQQDILNKIAAVPGVSEAAIGNFLPMSGNHWQDPIFAEDHPEGEDKIPPLRRFKIVSPGFLKTLGNRLIAGRDFTWDDVYQKHSVAMVSENLARELWQDPRAAIGQRIRENTRAPWHEVIAVVSDERDDGVDQKAPTSTYFPLLMDNFEGNSPFVQRFVTYVVRSSRAGINNLLNDLDKAVWSVNPDLPLANVRTLGDLYHQSMARTSYALIMLAVAAVMALLLGVAGIYGVVSYSVSQRTREVGIRRALGARNAELMGMFLRQAIRLTLLGIAAGLVMSLALIRLMSSLLFNITATDPVTYVGVSLILTVAALLAAYVPALHATGINPVEALRAE